MLKVRYLSLAHKNIISELVRGDRSNNGFIDRILFVIPTQNKSRWNDRDMSETVAIEWQNIINKLINWEYSLDENNKIQPNIIKFSEEARIKIYHWQHDNTDLCDKEQNEILLGFYCKLEIYIIRFCLVIQITRWLCGEASKEIVDAESIKRAIVLSEYFKNTAINVQNLMNETLLTAQQQSIVSALPSVFTTAQAIEVDNEAGMKERSLKEFISKNIGVLFKKDKHGEYSNYSRTFCIICTLSLKMQKVQIMQH